MRLLILYKEIRVRINFWETFGFAKGLGWDQQTKNLGVTDGRVRVGMGWTGLRTTKEEYADNESTQNYKNTRGFLQKRGFAHFFGANFLRHPHIHLSVGGAGSAARLAVDC